MVFVHNLLCDRSLCCLYGYLRPLWAPSLRWAMLLVFSVIPFFCGHCSFLWFLCFLWVPSLRRGHANNLLCYRFFGGFCGVCGCRPCTEPMLLIFPAVVFLWFLWYLWFLCFLWVPSLRRGHAALLLRNRFFCDYRG